MERINQVTIYPSSHHVTPEDVRFHAIQTIRQELKDRADYFEKENKFIERQRIQERTMHDVEMIKEVGFCKGIENYSRHFSQRKEGEPPPSLLDYFPKDFLTIIDESHQTIPQLHAMFNGDRARKQALVDFGFRLPSAFDNRPLKFEETYGRLNQIIYVSATPSPWEVEEAGGSVVEQVIRPTGLLEPVIEVRKAEGQVDDCLDEIRKQVQLGARVLITTLTKRLAEELTKYLSELGVKVKYLHSDVDTMERLEIIRDLRLGVCDVIVGINLLREGLDLPEVSLVMILDADKEGFLRSETALIQTCGRAARNINGRVIMYADKITKSIAKTLEVTTKRREIQIAYNKEHGITPTSTKREIVSLAEELITEEPSLAKETWKLATPKEAPDYHYLTQDEVDKKIKFYESEMKKAAKEMRFEEAAKARDQMRKYQQLELSL
jgi:excinuclease ABC subunit B